MSIISKLTAMFSSFILFLFRAFTKDMRTNQPVPEQLEPVSMEEIDRNKEEFFTNNKVVLDRWILDNPGLMPPVVKDNQGNWHWVNRKTRRALR